MEIDFKTVKRVHFIGIGGIGISAVARMMLGEGKRVSGNDTSKGEVVDELVKLGAVFTLGQKIELVPTDADLIIYSRAIEIADPAFLGAVKALGIPALSYPEALSIISKNKFTIAVSGTHGKTTTTAMIASVLLECGSDPTVIVGSMLKSHNSNFIAGQSEYLVLEADEYHRAFLNLYPKVLVITNIDKDHLDYFKDLEDIQSAFRELAERVPDDGLIIANPNLPNVAAVLERVRARVVVVDYSQTRGVPTLQFPGHHNIENAQVALALAQVLRLDTKAATHALAEFKGTSRRFEFKGESERGVLVYDDYAHNPQKVRAAIAGAREKFPYQKIIAVFQPHLFSRTKLLLDDFALSFADADEVIVLPIYAAREVDDGSIDNSKLVAEIKKYQDNVSAMSFDEAIEYVREETMSSDVLLTLGAGEAYRVGDGLLGK